MIENLASLRTEFTKKTLSPPGYFDIDDPRKLQHLCLEQQKNRAKDLLREWRSQPSKNTVTLQLHDAQSVIAQGHGFKNWSELKSHIVQIQITRDALNNGLPSALDANQRTLHIRCGSDIQHALAVAGFCGDFLVFADPYVHGPVPLKKTREEFIPIRARYISANFNLPYEKILKDLQQDYDDLETARNYDAVYIWSEHDSYDQLTLAKLLDFFSTEEHRPPVLKMINITHFPGVKIFNGIGQLPPEAMPVLWDAFTDVTAAQYTIGRQAWAAIRAATPQALQDLIAMGTVELPTLTPALDRHLKQLPSQRNGLNLTENLTLQILAEKGPMNAARLFGWYTNHYEPLTFMGDSGYWGVLADLATAEYAAISLDKKGESPKQWQVSLTATGKDLLVDKADWLKLNTIDRWVGGIHIETRKGNLFRIN
ncbi:MAG: DUF1835 domain-containing protein [Thiohalomonadales bacterium]